MRRHSPSVAHVASIARALGDLRSDVVFIGGAIAPLLQTDPVIPFVRATNDVDAVVATASYAGYNAFAGRLRAAGFVQRASDATHAHRWRSPDGIPFDVVPAGDHLSGTGSAWDEIVVETSSTTEIEPELIIRHASAPGFLSLKFAAFHDRGADDPFASHDLEDILALLVSRKSTVEEVRTAPASVRAYLNTQLGWLLDSDDYDDLVAAHLRNAAPFKKVATLLRANIVAILET